MTIRGGIKTKSIHLIVRFRYFWYSARAEMDRFTWEIKERLSQAAMMGTDYTEGNIGISLKISEFLKNHGIFSNERDSLMNLQWIG